MDNKKKEISRLHNEVKTSIEKRGFYRRDGDSISDDEYIEVKSILKKAGNILDYSEGVIRTGDSDPVMREIYDEAKRIRNYFGLYGALVYDPIKGEKIWRDERIKQSAVENPKTKKTSLQPYSRIVFERIGDYIPELPRGIYIINPDGSDSHPIRDNGRCPKWSPDGNWIAFLENTEDNGWLSSVFIMKPDGRDVRSITFYSDADATSPSWSPDSKRLAYSIWIAQTKQHQICVADLQTGHTKQITYKDDNAYPVWTPDNEIVFAKSTDRGQSGRLFIMSPDGQNQHECSLFKPEDYDPVWTYDGSRIVFRRENEFCMMNSEGNNLQIIPSHGRILKIVISPDAQSVAYTSCDDTGLSGFELFVINLNETGEKKIVANPCKEDNENEVDTQDISWSPWLYASHETNKTSLSYSDSKDTKPHHSKGTKRIIAGGFLSISFLLNLLSKNSFDRSVFNSLLFVIFGGLLIASGINARKLAQNKIDIYSFDNTRGILRIILGACFSLNVIFGLSVKTIQVSGILLYGILGPLLIISGYNLIRKK